MDATSMDAHRTRVCEAMTADPVTLEEDRSVQHAGIILLREGISGAPVMNRHGALVGVFSHADVLARFAAPRHRRGPLARIDDRHASAVTVGEACTRPPVTIGPEATIDTAARELLDRDIGRLVVVDQGKVVGILSRTDVLKLFLPARSAHRPEQREPDVQRQ